MYPLECYAGLNDFFERAYGAFGGTVVLKRNHASHIKTRELHPVHAILPLVMRVYPMHFLKRRTLQENARTSHIQPDSFERVLYLIGFKPLAEAL